MKLKTRKLKQTIHFFNWIIIILLISCNSQSQSNVNELDTSIKKEVEITNSKMRFDKGVTSIFEDSNGNFWFGSNEEGVCKFDGQNYTYYSTVNGLPSNSVREIQEDEKGNIWFATGKGVCFFNKTEFTTVPLKGDKNLVQIPYSQPLIKSGKWSLEEESIWISNYNNGVLRYKNGILENLNIPIPIEDTEYSAERNNRPYHFPYSAIKTYLDNEGKLWIGTFNRGIVGYDGKAFEYHNPNNFGVGTIRSIFQDKEGNHWFGSNGGGLYKYDGNTFRNFTEERGLTSSNPGYGEFGTLSQVWSIEQDNEGNMWFGTAGSGLWKFDGEEIINYSMKDGLPSNFVETIYKDKKGKLWFCSGMNSNGILYTFDGKTIDIINPIKGKM